MKILLVLCEGQHDVAFLYQIFRLGLRADDISSQKVSQFPEPLGPHFLSILKNYNYENAQIYGKPELPTILTLVSAGSLVYILIYPMGGDSKIPNWKAQIQMFQDLASSELSEEKVDVSIALFFDADKSALKRLSSAHYAFKELIPEIEALNLSDRVVGCTTAFKSLGLYIFSNSAGTGNLEDIIVPIMKDGNEQIFEEASAYLDNNWDKSRSKKYSVSKSIVSIVGQLQYSGVANNNVIKQSDYINSAKISTHNKCIEIMDFFTDILSVL